MTLCLCVCVKNHNTKDRAGEVGGDTTAFRTRTTSLASQQINTERGASREAKTNSLGELKEGSEGTLGASGSALNTYFIISKKKRSL